MRFQLKSTKIGLWMESIKNLEINFYINQIQQISYSKTINKRIEKTILYIWQEMI